MYKVFFFIFLIGLFSACIEVVDLDVEETPHELVVNCFFTENQPFEVNVSRLAPYPDLEDRNLENATVSIYENEILKGTLKHTENGIYTNKSITPTFGNMYSVRVEVPGYPTATANDTLPGKIFIEGYEYDAEVGKDYEGDSYGIVRVLFTDNLQASFYSIQLYTNWEKKEYNNQGDVVNIESLWGSLELTSNDPVIVAEGITEEDYPIFFVFNDVLFSNQPYSLSVRTGSYFNESDKKIVLETGTKHYYQYLKRLLKHERYSYEDPFKPYSPVPLYSNVSGGQGVFAGFQRDIYLLTFPN